MARRSGAERWARQARRGACARRTGPVSRGFAGDHTSPARLIQLFAELDPAAMLAHGSRPMAGRFVRDADAEEIEEPLAT